MLLTSANQPKQGKSDVPLVKSASKGAFRKNIKTEMAHGKPQKQAAAIAYSTKRKAQGRKGR